MGVTVSLEESNEDDEYLMDESKLGPPFGIVINGHSLVRKVIIYIWEVIGTGEGRGAERRERGVSIC